LGEEKSSESATQLVERFARIHQSFATAKVAEASTGLVSDFKSIPWRIWLNFRFFN
jgi:hypothetical protein